MNNLNKIKIVAILQTSFSALLSLTSYLMGMYSVLSGDDRYTELSEMNAMYAFVVLVGACTFWCIYFELKNKKGEK